MGAGRVLGALFGLAGLYYVSFYLLRSEPTTVVQAVSLFAAAGILLSQRRPRLIDDIWFGPQGLPATWRGWAAAVGLGLAAIVVFVLLDFDSHSASDTIIRTLPSLSLIAALAVKLAIEHSRPGSA